MSPIQRALEAWRDAERRLAETTDRELVPRLSRRLEQARRAYRRAATSEQGGTARPTDTEADGGHSITKDSITKGVIR